jgi:tRNA pseudouridine55 synthase
MAEPLRPLPPPLSPQQQGPVDWTEGQVLLVNKPLDWTSFDVVAKVRNLLRIKKIGHAGTLDPQAEGLLILCTGSSTKQIEQIQAAPKTYLALVRLGVMTASYDRETPEENPKDITHLTDAAIEAALAQFRGVVTQLPPVFSAVKIDGKRAYDMARKGQEVSVKPREVQIHALRWLPLPPDPTAIAPAHTRDLYLEVECSKGTYIRSLAHDLGQALGTGGYLAGLVRTAIGPYHLADAWNVPQLIERFGKPKSHTSEALDNSKS